MINWAEFFKVLLGLLLILLVEVIEVMFKIIEKVFNVIMAIDSWVMSIIRRVVVDTWHHIYVDEWQIGDEVKFLQAKRRVCQWILRILIIPYPIPGIIAYVAQIFIRHRTRIKPKKVIYNIFLMLVYVFLVWGALDLFVYFSFTRQHVIIDWEVIRENLPYVLLVMFSPWRAVFPALIIKLALQWDDLIGKKPEDLMLDRERKHEQIRLRNPYGNEEEDDDV